MTKIAEMIADAQTMPEDRQGAIEWHIERGATREVAEQIVATMFDEIPADTDV